MQNSSYKINNKDVKVQHWEHSGFKKKKYTVKQAHMLLQRRATDFVRRQKGASLEEKVNVHFHSEL